MVTSGSTTGGVSRMVRTERSPVSLSDFAKELITLEGRSEKANILIYGDSNAGKTRVAGTIPGRTFWLIGEPGYKSAARAGAKGRGHVIADPATAWAAIEYLEERHPRTKRARYEMLDWVVVDGASTMQDKFRLGYAQEAFDINPAKRTHRNLPDKPDYFNTQNMLKTWYARLTDMPVNLLVTAHAYRTDDTDGGERLVFPGFQGKVIETSNAISGLMDVTAYLEARRLRVRDSDRTKLVRRLWFETPERKRKEEEDIRYICGDKFDVLGTHMDTPTIPRMMSLINGTAASAEQE